MPGCKVTFLKAAYKSDSSETSGISIRIGNSSLNNYVDDTYWITLHWDGTLMVGLQLNGAKKPTWSVK